MADENNSAPRGELNSIDINHSRRFGADRLPLSKSKFLFLAEEAFIYSIYFIYLKEIERIGKIIAKLGHIDIIIINNKTMLFS